MNCSDNTSMGTSDFEDADMLGSYDDVSTDEAGFTPSVDPLIHAFETLEKPARGAPAWGKLFPGQPISHLAVSGAISHLRPGLASFPVASV
ncbi:hypothetical protein DUNSADRAFT_18092 [Dunaliella salina]|uniref:Encoded protein n=1 Tax=Dunaliella salina TaxID=3046 RepID=A0ABQ7G0P0_DUNSA|nr:hypothetical protein DUNSADRAFT_18092 [Dunaliella salina]|eukprot:KAF5828175.1 hypothetical protein DUNSADRAFT_18092 [Dunaliella salina]